MRTVRIAALVLTAVVLLAPAAGRADIIAATEVPGPSGGPTETDIALINVATGARLSLPAGINTAQTELHPSITPDGKRLVFERFDSSTGATRIIAVDLSTGQQADLFNAFDAAAFEPISPTITPDGAGVLTGAVAQPAGGGFVAAWTQTSLANFPGGPFAHTVRTASDVAVGSASASTRNPAVTPGGVVALDVPVSGTEGVLVDAGGSRQLLTESAPIRLSHPAPSDPDAVVVYEHAPFYPGASSLVFRSLGSDHLPQGTTLSLSGVVNAANATELHPTFTPDGRYLVFVREKTTGDEHAHLVVFDTVTQTLLDPTGADIGALPAIGRWLLRGNVSVRVASVLLATTVRFTGPNPVVQFQLAKPSGVGILVQRIVGRHRLLGHVVPSLKKVGRVPFGRFRRGSHSVRWNLRVNGRPLPRGAYLVTPRALTGQGVVSELGTSRHLTIR